VRFATLEFFSMIAKRQNGAPATRTRIARTSAVSVDGDALLAHAIFPLRMILSENRFPLFGIMR
jgi:hypothetical protein